MRRFPVIIAAVALALSGCMMTHIDMDTAQITPDQMTKLESSVRENLKDPGSATFRDVSATRVRSTGDIAICGEVNSKNGYGGYTGFQMFFMYLKPDGASNEITLEPEMATAKCHDRSYHLSHTYRS